jgi:hypothetical protein
LASRGLQGMPPAHRSLPMPGRWVPPGRSCYQLHAGLRCRLRHPPCETFAGSHSKAQPSRRAACPSFRAASPHPRRARWASRVERASEAPAVNRPELPSVLNHRRTVSAGTHRALLPSLRAVTPRAGVLVGVPTRFPSPGWSPVPWYGLRQTFTTRERQGLHLHDRPSEIRRGPACCLHHSPVREVRQVIDCHYTGSPGTTSTSRRTPPLVAVTALSGRPRRLPARTGPNSCRGTCLQASKHSRL